MSASHDLVGTTADTDRLNLRFTLTVTIVAATEALGGQMNVFLTSEDAGEIADLLVQEGVHPSLIEQKSGLQEVQMIAMALGGGMGIAAMIKAIGFALGKYFDGRATLEKAKKVRLRYKDKSIELNESDDLLQKLNALFGAEAKP